MQAEACACVRITPRTQHRPGVLQVRSSEYHLTSAGRDLYPVILTLLRWGDEHLAGPEGPPLVLEHTCGHRLVPEVTCQACGEVVDAADTARRSPTSP